MTSAVLACPVPARFVMAWRARQGSPGRGLARCGAAGLGSQGTAWSGVLRRSTAGLGMAGTSGSGLEWQGAFLHGAAVKVRQASRGQARHVSAGMAPKRLRSGAENTGPEARNTTNNTKDN